MIDMFACWFLLGNPHIREGSIASSMPFGFRETYNGVGVYVIKVENVYKIVAVQNLGNEQTTLKKLNNAFREGYTGCELDKSALNG